ncbi:MAG: hypothetical protein KDA50_03390 [Rhodobacteraceae bacterium]|nr:hypothetical protein [Paracoccaceae bacterium]
MIRAFPWMLPGAAGALLLAGAATAQHVEVECVFTTECYEAEPCDDTSFTVQLGKGDADGQAILHGPAETIVGDVWGHDATSLVWIARTQSSVQLISWGADGTARYTLHLTDRPAAVTYHGMCEAK